MEYGRNLSGERWYVDSAVDARRAAAVQEWAQQGYIVGAIVRWSTTENQQVMDGVEPSAASVRFDELCAIHGVEQVIPLVPPRALATELNFHPEAIVDDLTLYMVPGPAAH